MKASIYQLPGTSTWSSYLPWDGSVDGSYPENVLVNVVDDWSLLTITNPMMGGRSYHAFHLNNGDWASYEQKEFTEGDEPQSINQQGHVLLKSRVKRPDGVDLMFPQGEDPGAASVKLGSVIVPGAAASAPPRRIDVVTPGLWVEAKEGNVMNKTTDTAVAATYSRITENGIALGNGGIWLNGKNVPFSEVVKCNGWSGITGQAIATYLNDVYGPQVNVNFEVQNFEESGPDHKGIHFDGDDDGKVYATGGPEYEAAVPNAQKGKPGSTYNIDVWVVGGVVLKYGIGQYCYGYSHIESTSNVIVDGDVLTSSTELRSEIPKGREKEHLLQTIAHEIGHVMTRDVHPGDDGYQSKLTWGTDKDPYMTRRLMCTGDNTNHAKPGTCLIKAEWDRVENWLTSEEERLAK